MLPSFPTLVFSIMAIICGMVATLASYTPDHSAAEELIHAIIVGGAVGFGIAAIRS